MVGKTNATKITLTAPGVDLSMSDCLGNELPNRCTANCYVIRVEGEYKLPLVYGNAILHDEVNQSSFAVSEFVNYKNQHITSPYIETDTNTKANSTEISKIDCEGFISNVEIVSDSPCRSLKFRVNFIPSTGANAVLSILDNNRDIMWSWHIWCTVDGFSTYPIYSSTGDDYVILSHNLGQRIIDLYTLENGSCYYQWGRHVPFLPYVSEENLNEQNFGMRPMTSSSVAADNYAEAIKKPGVAFSRDSINYFWSINGFSMRLWNSVLEDFGSSDDMAVKTIYDPCPYPFVVPNGQVFTEFVTDRIYTTDIQYYTVFDFDGMYIAFSNDGYWRTPTTMIGVNQNASVHSYSLRATGSNISGSYAWNFTTGRSMSIVFGSLLPIRPMLDRNAL